MPRIKHIHSSGRYDRSQGKVRGALDRYADLGADVVTLTEYHGKDHRDVLTSWALTEEYDVGQGPGGEGNCAIAVRGPYFRIERFWHHQLSEHEQRRGPGGPPPPYAATALVEHVPSGERCLWSVAHLPPNIEGDWRERGPFGGRVYRVWLFLAVVAEWKRHTRALRKRYGVKAALVADWNLNMERPWVRAMIRARFPRLRLTWRRFPGPGTHHRRVIDATVTDMRITGPARLLGDDSSSDHRPYVEDLAY